LFFDRPQSGERAVLVHLDSLDRAAVDDEYEFRELVKSAGVDAVAVINSSVASRSPKFFVGSGKVQEIGSAVATEGAEVALFNCALSPSQERNLEKELQCRVLDRTGLILDIFAQRAKTHEGKLQVELAQLEHISTRLVRGWTHLERQKGGIGLRGPGETQLETDRRLLRIRIKSIKAKLVKVQRQRGQGRQARVKAELLTVSLVGYTNAGKSTLFNRLADAEVYVKDQLFATLDPTLRRLEVDELGAIILADTVGFIRDLPHRLVEAFRTTLQETASADLLLHVMDAADENKLQNMEQVDLVLSEIEAESIPRLLVFNKIDLVDQDAHVERDENGLPTRVWVSAKTGAGMDLLQQSIKERLATNMVCKDLELPASDGKMRAKLYERGAVLEEHINARGDFELKIRIPRLDYERLLRKHK